MGEAVKIKTLTSLEPNAVQQFRDDCATARQVSSSFQRKHHIKRNSDTRAAINFLLEKPGQPKDWWDDLDDDSFFTLLLDRINRDYQSVAVVDRTSALLKECDRLRVDVSSYMSEVKLSNTFWHHAIRLGFLGEKAEEQVGTNPTFTVEEREKFMKKITNNILKGVTEPNGQYALSFIQKHLDTQTRKTDSMTHYFRQISVKVQELRRLRDVVHDAQTEAVAAVRRTAHRDDDSPDKKKKVPPDSGRNIQGAPARQPLVSTTFNCWRCGRVGTHHTPDVCRFEELRHPNRNTDPTKKWSESRYGPALRALGHENCPFNFIIGPDGTLTPWNGMPPLPPRPKSPSQGAPGAGSPGVENQLIGNERLSFQTIL